MTRQPFVILVAEDDPNDALLLERAIRKNKIEAVIQFVPDGEEAIAYLEGTGTYHDREQFPRPRVIILDLKMPKKNGLEVLEWLRQNPEFQVIPTIVLSSSAHEQDILTAYRRGANTYMTKPGSFVELERMVQLIYDYWAVAKRVEGKIVEGKNSSD